MLPLFCVCASRNNSRDFLLIEDLGSHFCYESFVCKTINVFAVISDQITSFFVVCTKIKMPFLLVNWHGRKCGISTIISMHGNDCSQKTAHRKFHFTPAQNIPVHSVLIQIISNTICIGSVF